MNLIINQNVNYANHTNSSSPKWNNSSATSDSLSTIIRDKTIVICEIPSPGYIIEKEEQLTK